MGGLGPGGQVARQQLRLGVCCGLERPDMLVVMPRNRRRRNPRMTAVIATAATAELVTLLNWLSQYSGGRLKEWQLPALIGAILLTGWLAISQGGARQNRPLAI